MSITWPNAYLTNVAEPALCEPGRLCSTFEFLEESHPLDRIRFAQRDYSKFSDNVEMAKQEYEYLSGKKFDPKKSTCRESFLGIAMSTHPRKHYKSTIKFLGKLTDFFHKKIFKTTEVFAKNSPLAEGAISSSFNRVADRITMMRKIEAEDGSSDLYTGRPDTPEKAREQAIFLFQSEYQLWKNPKTRHLAKGIRFNEKTQKFEFRYSLQSLLTLHTSEKAKLEAEIKALDAISCNLLEVPNLDNSREILSVVPMPLPVAASNFNYMNRVEQILPDRITGKQYGEALTKRADHALFEYAKHHLADESRDHSQDPLIRDAMYQLEHGNLKAWQQILNRALLCHLLKLPQVVHCKSSVDRTNIAGAMITAMKQWLRSGQEIPKIKGRFAIHDLVNVRVEGDIAPFKELVACSLTRGLKITEFTRLSKGFKFNRGFWQHPALLDLLPESHFEPISKSETIRNESKWKRILVILLTFIGWIIRAKDFFPTKRLREVGFPEYLHIGPHPLLIPKKIASGSKTAGKTQPERH